MQQAVLPDWTIWVIGFGTPLAALLGVLLGQWVSRRSASELETRSKREETLRNMRWASELSVSSDERTADLGVAQLEALLESDLLDEKEKVFVEAALGTVYETVETELDQLGPEAETVQYVNVDDSAGATEEVQVDVSSDCEEQDRTED